MNNNIVNKIKCIYRFNYKIELVHKEQQKQLSAYSNKLLVHKCISYNQYIQNKIRNKLNLKAVNYTCLKLEEKIIRSVKKNKSNFINVIGDKFVIIIR